MSAIALYQFSMSWASNAELCFLSQSWTSCWKNGRVRGDRKRHAAHVTSLPWNTGSAVILTDNHRADFFGRQKNFAVENSHQFFKCKCSYWFSISYYGCQFMAECSHSLRKPDDKHSSLWNDETRQDNPPSKHSRGHRYWPTSVISSDCSFIGAKYVFLILGILTSCKCDVITRA